MMIEKHLLRSVWLSVAHLFKHLQIFGIFKESECQGLVFRNLVAERIARIAGEPSHVLKAHASTPERIEVAIIILSNKSLVDVVSKIAVVSGTTREEDSIQLLELFVIDRDVVLKDDGHDAGASRLNPVNIGLHNVASFVGHAWILLQRAGKRLAHNPDHWLHIGVEGGSSIISDSCHGCLFNKLGDHI